MTDKLITTDKMFTIVASPTYTGAERRTSGGAGARFYYVTHFNRRHLKPNNLQLLEKDKK